jgi:hypothetical protein
MSIPTLPRFVLQRGAHRVEVLDPRPDPTRLGARYVHGGYIFGWQVGGRELTSSPTPFWQNYHGRGLPETFELPVGWAQAAEGDPYLRIGAGQLYKRGRHLDEGLAAARLTAVVQWQVTDQSAEHLVMRTQDGLDSEDLRVRYELERLVRVHDDGIESRTTLTFRCGFMAQHPIAWFAHPFFAQTGLAATRLTIPGGEHLTLSPMGPWARQPMASGLVDGGADGWRFAQPGRQRATFGNLWGSQAPLTVHLDPALGGGQVAIAVDRPLDHLVVWANDRSFSPEPKLSRMWLDGETASWAIRYRFAPGPG